jgi:c-di-GMP-related signal transduction protein
MPTTTASPHPASTELNIARQAILDETRKVYGYELFDLAAISSQHTPVTDSQLLFNVLSLVDHSALAGKKTLFLQCTHDSLASGHLDLIGPEHIVLEVPQLPLGQMDQVQSRLPNLQEMHRRGYRMAFDYSVLTRAYEPWLELASFIKFDLTALNLQNVESLIRLAQLKSNATLIAEKVTTTAQHALVAKLGVKLFQGYWFAEPVVVAGQTLKPSQATILQLISLVHQQASINEIEELLKRDPTVSFNLLRFINSAGFGLRTEVISFKHAVMLLGMKRLFKWATLLMTTSNRSDVAPAVSTTAIVRARLMELLAAEILPAEESDNAFVVGMFSLLDTMLGMPMPAVLASVSLPANVFNALLHKTGPLAELLKVCIACENGDQRSFAHAISLGLSSSQINTAHLQAIAWAGTLSA